MKLIRGIHNLSQAPQEGCVLTIGNFDGVHRGHRALLQGLQEEGRKRNLPVMVMLFEPQPLELFATDKAPARLTRLMPKSGLIERINVVLLHGEPLWRAFYTAIARYKHAPYSVNDL